VRAFAPGRVNLIGEHTDYNAGLALAFAIREGVTVHATALDEQRIEAVALDLDATDSVALDAIEPAAGWRAFVRGVTSELQQAGVLLRGARLEITGDVPLGGGLASSAALEVAVALALLAVADAAPLDPLALAVLCSRAENEWAGVRSGVLDQTVSLLAEPDRCVQIDFRSLSVKTVPLELGDFKLVTLDSGERHANAGSGYNERRDECARACEQLGVASLRDADLASVEQLPAPLAGRARHVIRENARVEEAAAALERSDMRALGALLDASHASLRDDYEVSTPALDATVAYARESGALGARMIGGGFGGHVLALLPPGVAPPAGALEVRPGPGARLLG